MSREGSGGSYHEGQGTHNNPISCGDGSQGSTHWGTQRSKFSSDREEDMERLLAEEELMLKACEHDRVPPGFHF